MDQRDRMVIWAEDKSHCGVLKPFWTPAHHMRSLLLRLATAALGEVRSREVEKNLALTYQCETQASFIAAKPMPVKRQMSFEKKKKSL